MEELLAAHRKMLDDWYEAWAKRVMAAIKAQLKDHQRACHTRDHDITQ